MLAYINGHQVFEASCWASLTISICKETTAWFEALAPLSLVNLEGSPNFLKTKVLPSKPVSWSSWILMQLWGFFTAWCTFSWKARTVTSLSCISVSPLQADGKNAYSLELWVTQTQILVILAPFKSSNPTAHPFLNITQCLIEITQPWNWMY